MALHCTSPSLDLHCSFPSTPFQTRLPGDDTPMLDDSVPRFYQGLSDICDLLGLPTDTPELTLCEQSYLLPEISFAIRRPLHLKSACQTKLICKSIVVLSSDVTISDLEIVGAIVGYQVADLTVVDCKLERGDSSSGGTIVLTQCQNVRLERLELHDLVNSPGVFAERGTFFSLRDSTVRKTGKYPSVAISFESTAVLAKCVFSESGDSAIKIHQSSKCEIEECEMHHTAKSAISIWDSEVIMENSLVHDVSETAVSATACAQSRFLNSHFHHTKSSCLSIAHQSSKAHIEGNTFEDIEGNAIYICDHATVTAVRNRITRASYPAFAVLQQARATLKLNNLSHLEKAGICVRNAKSAILEENTISHCGECGVSISDTEECNLTRNTISECGVAALEAYNDSHAIAIGNRFVNTGKYALMAFTGGRVTASENVVSGVEISMVNLTTFGGGTFTDNSEIVDCPLALTGLTSAQYLFRNNGELEAITDDEALAIDGVRYAPTPIDPTAGKCLLCGVGPRQLHCAPCGHKVFCTACGGKGEGLICPLCRFAVTSVTEGFRMSEDGLCQLCLSKPADGIVLPCGHIDYCVDCLATWFQGKTTCPTCNSSKVTFKKVLPDY
jgi:parallel beta-helix repeat protein